MLAMLPAPYPWKPQKSGRQPEMGISRILRIREVVHVTGLSRSTIYRQMAVKEFPQAVRLAPQTVGWREHEIEAWIVGLPLADSSDLNAGGKPE